MGRHPAHDLDEQLALDDLDAFVQARLVVVVADLDGTLRDDRSGVRALVDEDDTRPGHLDAVGQRVADAVGAGERRQQRGVGVDGAVAELARGRRRPGSA